jgi:hypothetical protein
MVGLFLLECLGDLFQQRLLLIRDLVAKPKNAAWGLGHVPMIINSHSRESHRQKLSFDGVGEKFPARNLAIDRTHNLNYLACGFWHWRLNSPGPALPCTLAESSLVIDLGVRGGVDDYLRNNSTPREFMNQPRKWWKNLT